MGNTQPDFVREEEGWEVVSVVSLMATEPKLKAHSATMCLDVGVYSTLTSCSPPVSSMLTTTTTTKSCRSDTLIILPGWECHTGGSRSKPTVQRCSQSGRRLWVARHVHNHEPSGSAAVRQCQH